MKPKYRKTTQRIKNKKSGESIKKLMKELREVTTEIEEAKQQIEINTESAIKPKKKSKKKKNTSSEH